MNGNELKKLREKHGYSRQFLAKKIDVTVAIIKSWEEGWNIINPSSGEIEGMSELFNIPENTLREIIDQNAENDYENQEIRFSDLIDAGVRALKHYKCEK